MMNDVFIFSIMCIFFNEDYQLVEGMCIIINFVNLVCGVCWQENLCNIICMINNCFNDLVYWDNLSVDCYVVELDIILVEMYIDGNVGSDFFFLIEVLCLIIVDMYIGVCIEGIVGNNFLFYVCDYDFSVVFLVSNEGKDIFGILEGFGDLYGKLFKYFLELDVYCVNFSKGLVICISVFSSRIYYCIENYYLILGVEYCQGECFFIDQYFDKMGLWVCYFMLLGSVVLLVFYFQGDLLGDYLNLELIGIISMMEVFQKIYCFEIYNVNFVVGKVYQFSLKYQDYFFICIVYDCEECSQLVVKQGWFIEEYFIKLYCVVFEQWVVC